ncbi:MAG: hypothetical protein WDO71_20095 [Bacteroidota bacterium]
MSVDELHKHCLLFIHKEDFLEATCSVECGYKKTFFTEFDKEGKIRTNPEDVMVLIPERIKLKWGQSGVAISLKDLFLIILQSAKLQEVS